MKTYLGLVFSVLLPLSGFLTSAKADQIDDHHHRRDDHNTVTIDPFSLDLFDNNSFDGLGSTSLPRGTHYSADDPLTLILDLPGDVTLGDDINYIFGLSFPHTSFVENADVFDFSITLYDGHTQETAPFGFIVSNSFDFSITNISVQTSTDLLAPDDSPIDGVTFDKVKITISVPPSAPDPFVNSFTADFDNYVPPVPDGGASLALLAVGLASLAAFARCGRVVAQRFSQP